MKAEEVKLGGGHYECSKCGETVFGSALHYCNETMNEQIKQLNEVAEKYADNFRNNIISKRDDDFVRNEIIDRLFYNTIDCPECESIIGSDEQYQCLTCGNGGKINLHNWVKAKSKDNSHRDFKAGALSPEAANGCNKHVEKAKIEFAIEQLNKANSQLDCNFSDKKRLREQISELQTKLKEYE